MEVAAASVRRVEEVEMTHPCACCALRFTTSAELIGHVRDEHMERVPFTEGQVTVVRPRRFQAAVSRHRNQRPAPPD